ncbi:GerAB/ArcD/ProY family transporter [Cohnella sp.]|uniref:GerAB/ArcD/ProY family transporter n=1 Tax=Cohnella sp. TaxID=1883426 RepID=UPI003568FE39
MDKSKINVRQLFALIVLFEVGTALVVPIGLTAERDVWFSIFLALLGGILLFLVYDYLYRQYPDLPISGYARKILGQYIGWPLCLTYVIFFIYNGSRDLRDAGDLLATSTYDQTPVFVLNAIMIMAVVYVLYKGMEVLARLGEIYLIILICLGALGNIFVLFSGIIDLKNMFPMFHKGWVPVFKAAYPNIFMFPFGEMICFTTILPYLNRSQLGRKTGVYALIFSGIILSFTHAVEISVLGINMYERSTFPLFSMIGLVNIADFLQRLDAIVILTLIIGDFFKIAIFCYAAVIVAADIFNVQKQKLVLPIGIVVLFSSVIISENWTEHIEEGSFHLKAILPIYALAIPVLLLMVHIIRKRFSLYRSNNSQKNKR